MNLAKPALRQVEYVGPESEGMNMSGERNGSLLTFLHTLNERHVCGSLRRWGRYTVFCLVRSKRLFTLSSYIVDICMALMSLLSPDLCLSLRSRPVFWSTTFQLSQGQSLPR